MSSVGKENDSSQKLLIESNSLIWATVLGFALSSNRCTIYLTSRMRDRLSGETIRCQAETFREYVVRLRSSRISGILVTISINSAMYLFNELLFRFSFAPAWISATRYERAIYFPQELTFSVWMRCGFPLMFLITIDLRRAGWRIISLKLNWHSFDTAGKAWLDRVVSQHIQFKGPKFADHRPKARLRRNLIQAWRLDCWSRFVTSLQR